MVYDRFVESNFHVVGRSTNKWTCRLQEAPSEGPTRRRNGHGQETCEETGCETRREESGSESEKAGEEEVAFFFLR